MLASMWMDMFYLGLPVAEKVLRPVVVYVFLIVGLRLAGKRELAQLNPFDLIVLLTLSNTVQNAIIGNDTSVSGGLIGAATLLGLNYAVVRFLYSHKRLDRLLEGKRDVLVREGKVQRDHLHRELITIPELKAAMHRQGICTLEEVQQAVLEPSGVISFTVKTPTPDTQRHDELMGLLKKLSEEVGELRVAQGRKG
jgi:uncharacterized membrane protein YcaP (DUF421 family)